MVSLSFLNVVEVQLCGNGLSSLVNLSLNLTKLVLFDWPNNSQVNIVETDRSVLHEDSFLRCWHCLSLLNYIRTVTLYQLLKLPPSNLDTAWKVPKYGVFSGPYFPVFGRIQENTDQKTLRLWTLSRSGALIYSLEIHSSDFLLYFYKFYFCFHVRAVATLITCLHIFSSLILFKFFQ